ncbi:protoporphyrinogen oxidase [Radiomyces spectabilis]|uniref:protoporphyrinogen oxidase n=1 Tax=Radiomyces spectabilis TaxID=64574 RepID=UPI0022211476|nr:protoporphyrinogen oxidase [Radiomyces spectabilis]KAI8377663.1 protoporphyrinogen oxidase [Radiomyces spectabilis]
MPGPTTVAVVGGGISGLSAAFYLSKLAPATTKILLIEGTNRVGGWIRSRRIAPGHYSSPPFREAHEKDDNAILVEAGPRSLRPGGPAGAIMLEMIRDLGLKDALLYVPKTHPSAKHRYIYYDGKINTLPSSLSEFLFKRPPIFKSVMSAGLCEPFIPKKTFPEGQDDDESLYDFMVRRFNKHCALNLMGALAHGVYAGDVKQLSLKSTFRVLYEAERAKGSVVRGMASGAGKSYSFRERGMAARARQEDPEWFASTEDMSVIGLKDGMESVTLQLRAWLENQGNVQIITDEPVQQISRSDNDKEIKITTTKSEFYAEHAIAAVPSIGLDKLLAPGEIPFLAHNPSADVAVVNVAYPADIPFSFDGFGFLTPHKDSKSKIPVPGTLGVIFDSNALPGQDPHRSDVIKFTAMIGGSDYNEAFQVPITQLDPSAAYDHTLNIMKSFLGIDTQPTHSMVNLLPRCIPQYLVGHERRLTAMHQALQQHYGHLMSVTGASYLGVSVPDCIKNSRALVEELLVSGALGTKDKIVTGLGSAVEGKSRQEMVDSSRISKSHVDILMKA